MTRADRAIVGALATVLLVLSVAVGVAPASPPQVPVAAGSTPTPSPPVEEARTYREGVVGRPTSITPLTARTQADRDLVALIFSGLVRLGPSDTLVPDLATRWSTNKKGTVWTFKLRDALWHDGVAVTAADVVFTVHLIQDPNYAGPALGSWKDVTATAVDEHTVRFRLATPLGGFLQAATLPILPAHLLEGVAVDQLATDPFAQAPVGTGPFRLASLAPDQAILAPANAAAAPAASGVPEASLPAATTSPGIGSNAGGPAPLPGIELRFFDDPVALARAYEAGELDAASGLAPVDATRLGARPGSRLIRYPTTTLTAVFFNLRGANAFGDPRVRRALLTAIDRASVVQNAYGGAAAIADSLIPPTSWAFDRAASPHIEYSRQQAAKALRDSGWRRKSGKWIRPKTSRPVRFELLGPDARTNPQTSAAVTSIAADWQRLGLEVTKVGLAPSTLVTDRIETARFLAVVVDIDVGLDPDVYPLLASTQTRTGGLNISGLQDEALDKLLAKARAPGAMGVRKAAYKALQERLSAGQFVLPICFRDELVVVRDTMSGPVSRPIADGSGRFWDVLSWRLAIDR